VADGIGVQGREPDIFESADGSAPSAVRPWLGVRFSCSGAYLRVYRSVDGTQYRATCPRCGRAVVFRVGQGGTPSRFFEVRCGG